MSCYYWKENAVWKYGESCVWICKEVLQYSEYYNNLCTCAICGMGNCDQGIEGMTIYVY